jgi:nucleoid-associated protein YgaU
MSDRAPASAGSALARDTTQGGPRHGVSGGRDRSPAAVDADGRVRPATGGSRPRTRARVTAAGSQPAATYRVRPGDSLWRIASRHLGADATDLETAQEVSRLWKLNEQRIGTGNPDLIFPGQTLRM